MELRCSRQHCWNLRGAIGCAHAHAGEDGQVMVLLEVRVLHRTTGERACGTVSRSRAEPGWCTPRSSRMAETQKTDAGYADANLACGRAGRTRSRWLRRILDGTGAKRWLMSWRRDGFGVGQCQVRQDISRVTVCARSRASFVGPSSVADAVSLIRTSSQKKRG